MNARHEIARHGKVDQKIPPSYLKALTIALATAFLLGCSDGDPMRRSAGSPAATYELAPVVNPGGVSGLNYTPHYIVRFGITGENGMRGGGPNIRRAEGDGPAGGGAETCCIGIQNRHHERTTSNFAPQGSRSKDVAESSESPDNRAGYDLPAWLFRWRPNAPVCGIISGHI